MTLMLMKICERRRTLMVTMRRRRDGEDLKLGAEQKQHHIDRHEQERSCLAWEHVMAMLRRPSSAPNKRWPPLSSLLLHSFAFAFVFVFVFVFGHHFCLCYFAPLNFFRRFVLWRTTTQPCWWFWAARLQSLGKTSTAPALR